MEDSKQPLKPNNSEGNLDEEKYRKKVEELRCKEVKNIIYDSFIK